MRSIFWRAGFHVLGKLVDKRVDQTVWVDVVDLGPTPKEQAPSVTAPIDGGIHRFVVDGLGGREGRVLGALLCHLERYG